MKIPTHMQDVLIWYDGPQLFTVAAPAALGNALLCLAVTDRFDSTEYLCAPVDSAELALIQEGATELRQFYLNPDKRLFRGTVRHADPEQVLHLVSQDPKLLPEDDLPAPGCYLQ